MRSELSRILPLTHNTEETKVNKVLSVAAAIIITSVVLTGCSREEEPVAVPAKMPSVAPETSASKAQAKTVLRSFFDENYAIDMARYPVTASYRGIKTNHDKWNSLAESHIAESRQISEARLLQLETIDRESLSPAEQLSWDLYQVDLQRRIASDDFRHHKFVLHQFRGPHTQVASFLINIHTIGSVADAKAYVSRLENVGFWFDQVIEQLHIREQKNLLLADWQYPQMIEASKNIISGVPYDDSGVDSTLWIDFQQKLDGLEMAAQQREALLEAARTALIDVVKPAYQRLIAALEKQGAMASGDDGVWKFDNGDAFYAERLRWFTTTELSADDIHTIGLSEVARIHGAMQGIMDQVGFDGTLAEFFVFMREDEQFYYPNTDAGRAAYLAEANRLIDDMRERLPQMFGLLPQAELVVKRVEAFRERSAGKAFYQGPPSDGSRPGIYYANLYRMADMPNYQMAALAYHEGVPGHHMQRAISVELQDIPEFQRYASFTAFTEGWGLYTEQLPKEMGLYQDPYSDFGRLAMELWRACRLVVDTGIHSKRWTREEAIDYLVLNTPNSAGDATKAIERYIAMPGQATAYLIGKLKIIELREKARSALGEEFDIRQFHDLVLKDGPVPLALLESKVDAMLAAGTGKNE